MKIDVAGIQSRYEEILDRIAAACKRAGRSPDSVTLVAVSKTFPASYIEVLYDYGHRDFGESKVQELTQKQSDFRSRDRCPEITWHMIGHLQRNKAREVIGIASMIHSIDSVRLTRELEKRAGGANEVVPCLLQVNISGEHSKYGAAPDVAVELLRELDSYENVSFRGLMGMAAPTENPEMVRSEFVRLRRILDACNRERDNQAPMSVLSMGMSEDFEVAIEEGATHVRIGSAIFGSRSQNPDL